MLKCHSVEKELAVFAREYNLVGVVILAAVARQRVGVDRMSFVDMSRWLAEAEPGEAMRGLVVNPARPDSGPVSTGLSRWPHSSSSISPCCGAGGTSRPGIA
jgi:hypothetical protein